GLAVAADEARRAESAAALGLGGRGAQALLDVVGTGARKRRFRRDAQARQEIAQDPLVIDRASRAELGRVDGAAEAFAPTLVQTHMGEARGEQGRLRKRIGPAGRQTEAGA